MRDSELTQSPQTMMPFGDEIKQTFFFCLFVWCEILTSRKICLWVALGKQTNKKQTSPENS